LAYKCGSIQKSTAPTCCYTAAEHKSRPIHVEFWILELL